MTAPEQIHAVESAARGTIELAKSTLAQRIVYNSRAAFVRSVIVQTDAGMARLQQLIPRDFFPVSFNQARSELRGLDEQFAALINGSSR